MPTPAQRHFAALARSSPWRWTSLRLTVAWRGRLRREPVRAWIHRPDRLRVEDLTGAVLQSGRHDRSPPSVAVLSSYGRGKQVPPPDPRAEPPELDDAGLVVGRPQGPGMQAEDPMFDNYHWVAMLDPVELADGHGRLPGDPGPEPVEIRQLREVDHHGSPAWEASLRTTEAYDPRCSCCALLFSVHSEDREAEAGGPCLRDREPQLRYPDAHRVRLDVATGVCVLTEEIGGSHAGTGHEARIEAVDQEMPDDLFGPEPRPRWWHRSR